MIPKQSTEGRVASILDYMLLVKASWGLSKLLRADIGMVTPDLLLTHKQHQKDSCCGEGFVRVGAPKLPFLQHLKAALRRNRS